MESSVSSGRHVGHFASWDGGCLLIGRAGGVVPEHAHYAIQLAFGATPGIRFRPSEHDEWTACAGAIIPSRQPHAMDATHSPPSAVIFIEPETSAGRALTERYLADGIAAMPDAVLAHVGPMLFTAWREAARGAGSTATVIAAARHVVEALTDGVPPSVVSDERVLRAVSYIGAHLNAPLTLDAVAAEACLSPSRFRHLFVEETGMALRPYILWRSFLHVWEIVMAGGSLSMAAHTAGFADAAHLTRTSRRMFGFPPSAIQMIGALPPGPTAGSASVVAGDQPLRSILGRVVAVS
jgi:AraC-like DNA-binding protein